ncbi:MAG: TlpA disulfide reductase family protein [Mucilaginibacter sp.]
MKKLQLIILLLACTKMSMGQLLLTGNIKGSVKGDSVEVNLSYDGNYWAKNSVYLKTDVAGKFHTAYPYHTPKFIMLIYKSAKQYLLLSPGRPLYVSINNSASPIFAFAGKAKPENDLIQKLNLEVTELPFVKELKVKNSYATWPVDSVVQYKVPAIMHSLDSTQKLVNQSNLPASTKKIIATEVRYEYADAVSVNVGSWLNNRKNRANFNLHFIDTVLKKFGLPTKNELDGSLYANLYLNEYFRFKSWKGIYTYNANPDKVKANEILKASTGIDYDDLLNEIKKDGNEEYAFTTRITAAAPQYAWEKQLTNLMFNFCMSSQLQSADKLLYFIKGNLTNEQYIAAAEKMFIPLKKERDQYAHNLNIRIRPDYKSISSLKELMAPYKGKVVLVDMWYTQCPPCIAELAYDQPLKARFKDKDVIFLNIALEEDKDDEIWRDFILINNIPAEHVRRTRNQMGPLWNELGVIDSQQKYPTYIIFDREGKVAVKDASRPSEREALYSQIENVLNK